MKTWLKLKPEPKDPLAARIALGALSGVLFVLEAATAYAVGKSVFRLLGIEP